MNKITDILKNIRFSKIRLPKWKVGNLRKLKVRRVILWGIALALSIGLFVFLRGFTACWQLTALPGIRPASCPGGSTNPLGTPVVNPEGTPLVSDLPPTPQVLPQVQYPQWDGGSRINILFIGLDYRDYLANQGPPRTDSMILFTIDPVSQSAGMLSIPRDMWVNIPGFGYSRINTAYPNGEGARLPGGGPGLAMKTVSQFIGVPVQYYIQIDFDTFVAIINKLKGIDVYNDERLVLDLQGQNTSDHVITCCGMRHLSGQQALAYARTRHTQGGDVDRAVRQQKVIFAIRDKVFSPEYFPTFIAQAPDLFNTFSSGIHTNMSLDDAVKLAVLARGIPQDRIRPGVIDDSMVSYATVTLGGVPADIFKPIPDKIRVLRDQIFTIGGPVSPMAQGDPTALMQADGAHIRVTNNTYTPNLDSRTGNYLIASGMQVTELGQPTGVSDRTTVILYTPKLYALRYLITLFGINSSNQILIKNDPSATADIEIRLGNDWAGRLPAGY